MQRRGAYHIITRGGAYYVDGVLASDYGGVGVLVPRPLAELARLYAVARYELGVPGVPYGQERLVSSKWLSDLLGLVAPTSALPLLLPITLPVALLTARAGTRRRAARARAPRTSSRPSRWARSASPRAWTSAWTTSWCPGSPRRSRSARHSLGYREGRR